MDVTGTRLAMIRGKAAPKSHNARTIAALASNPGCARRAIMDAAGVEQRAATYVSLEGAVTLHRPSGATLLPHVPRWSPAVIARTTAAGVWWVTGDWQRCLRLVLLIVVAALAIKWIGYPHIASRALSIP